ncbi:MAG TPA: DUF885 domain-containing protein [Steroidobacteraceae bacterium]
MVRSVARLAGLVLVLCTVSAVHAATTAAAAASGGAFQEVVDALLADLYARNPTYATDLGLHEFDGRLEDYSAASIAAELQAVAKFEAELERIDPKELSQVQRQDRELLLLSLVSRRLDAERVRPLERNPDVYSSGITNSAYALIKRDYAPAEQRLRSLVEREKAMPSALLEARRNLRDVPRIYAEIAIEQLDGNQEFFRSAVTAAFAGAGDAALQAEFKRTNDAVIRALGDYKTWLQQTLLPKATGSFAWGADLYQRKLRADEMIDTPIAELERIALQDLRRNQAWVAAAAKQVDPKKSPLEVLDAMQRDHPPPDKLLATTQADLDALGRFMTERHIVTIPQDAPPAQVQETPPFMRATTSASMDTPGPFEQGKLQGFYSMTLPDPAWPAARKEEFMRQWFYPLITNVSVHEVWPGHYLQFLYAPTYPSVVRKVMGSNANAEGWAHYCEQMVIDEGFHADDPRYRLAQLQDALLRDARFIVGIRLHTQGMTLQQAEDFFVTEGYQPRPVAVSETKRGTSDALYGYYTMGKLAILKLRADYQRKLGPAFRLQDFHDRFIGLGPLPLPLVREAMLGERGTLF